MNGILFTLFCIILISPYIISAHKRQMISTRIEGIPNDLDMSPYKRVGEKLLYFGQSKVSWFKANLVCRSMNGFLASVESAEEMNDISQYLKDNQPNDRWWWLSGSDIDAEGDFYSYKTGERINYAGWSSGQPDNMGGNEHCMHLWFLNKKYEMNDWGCKEKAYYICESETPATFLISVH